jgi:hypothetical protein
MDAIKGDAIDAIKRIVLSSCAYVNDQDLSNKKFFFQHGLLRQGGKDIHQVFHVDDCSLINDGHHVHKTLGFAHFAHAQTPP